MNCPRFGSPNIVKNCATPSAKQNFKCIYCHRQFV
ncbi:IS1/IS1595 family N-terminal zinc-binding domain-containing protein [Microcoleus vaginatus]